MSATSHPQIFLGYHLVPPSVQSPKRSIVRDRRLRKIPIIISKCDEDGIKGWRAEIADNYEKYKPCKIMDINFEDIGFHFHHNFEMHDFDQYVFLTKKDAIDCAKLVNEIHLEGRGKIYFFKSIVKIHPISN